MKKLSALLLIALLLVTGCQPSESAIQTAVAQTQAAQPTATQIPFSEFDLEDFLIQENDLPAGYSGAQVSNSAPEMFNDIPKTDYTIYQQFQIGNKQAGGVGVFLYENKDSMERAYERIADGMGDTNAVERDWDKGELRVFSVTEPFIISFVDLVFANCFAVVHIRLTDTDNDKDVITYAERLNKRLTPLVCR